MKTLQGNDKLLDNGSRLSKNGCVIVPGKSSDRSSVMAGQFGYKNIYQHNTDNTNHSQNRQLVFYKTISENNSQTPNLETQEDPLLQVSHEIPPINQALEMSSKKRQVIQIGVDQIKSQVPPENQILSQDYTLKKLTSKKNSQTVGSVECIADPPSNKRYTDRNSLMKDEAGKNLNAFDGVDQTQDLKITNVIGKAMAPQKTHFENKKQSEKGRKLIEDPKEAAKLASSGIYREQMKEKGKTVIKVNTGNDPSHQLVFSQLQYRYQKKKKSSKAPFNITKSQNR